VELIVKPTERCNFKCSFCSSTALVDDRATTLELERIYAFLRRFPQTSTIILNGGDPLMMPPEYYWKILAYIEREGLPTTLSFTSNLWLFYLKPDVWTPLFRHERVGVTTSFHYGDTRRISHAEVFTEEKFWAVSDLFLERVGYRPDFISVITPENHAGAIENVRLARRMDVECKLNYAVASGLQSRSFLKGHVYRVYLDVIAEGLAEWEYNSKQLLALRGRLGTTCPLSRDCDSNIRCLQPEGDYYSCGAFGDDKSHAVDFDAEVLRGGPVQTPLEADERLAFLKPECLGCPLFAICNGCKKTISDLKAEGRVEEHCGLMQGLLPELRPYVS